MKDICVTHDKVGVYSYWNYSSFHEGIQEPWLTRYWHDYFEGKRKPNYPVPAIYECPWCGSKHQGHTHWITEQGFIVPN